MNTTTDLRACARAAWCREPDSEAQQICVWQGQVRLRKQLVDSKMPPMPWSVPESMHMNLHFCIYFCCSIYPSVSHLFMLQSRQGKKRIICFHRHHSLSHRAMSSPAPRAVCCNQASFLKSGSEGQACKLLLCHCHVRQDRKKCPDTL